MNALQSQHTRCMVCRRLNPAWLLRMYKPASVRSSLGSSPYVSPILASEQRRSAVRSCSSKRLHASTWGSGCSQRFCSSETSVARPSTAAAASPAETQLPPAEESVRIELPTSDESEELLRIRHSASHVMAMALQKLFPAAQTTIGPWIERGFYYDFDLPEPLSSADLKNVKKEMVKIIKSNKPFICEEVTKEQALERMAHEPYKLELVNDILKRDPEAKITLYHIGEPGSEGHWYDLCAGPHVEKTGDINPAAVALETVAGAYWRGDEKNAQLQRVYGTAWQSKEQLKAYQDFKAEAEKRDHRKLGQQLDLFSINDSGGPGLVFWHPKGAMVRHLIESYWKDVHLKHGYELIYSPHIAKMFKSAHIVASQVDLWKTSGHFEFYGENMFDQMEVEEEEYQLRPMNCPFHIAIYNQKQHSYRDLPRRWAELGTVYRYERSGTMHGLFRVRGFTQDDAHIFCLPDQIAAEIGRVLDLIQDIMVAFGFRPEEFEINLSTRPEKSVGSDDIWQTAEAALQTALQTKGYDFVVDEGGGAFYGPKIDIKVRDAIGRKWQCSTVQLDFNLPDRFDMKYTDKENAKQRPIMIHRAIFGSIERFFGILIENYAGAFPLWLAPVQVALLLVAETEELRAYADSIVALLQSAGIRVEVKSGERMPKLIRAAQTEKIPVTAVIGEQEAKNRSLAVRLYGPVGDIGQLSFSEVKARLQKAVTEHISFDATPADSSNGNGNGQAESLQAAEVVA